MTEEKDTKALARLTAYIVTAVAGLFVLCVTTLLVATWIQLTVHDPLDSPALLALKETYAKGNKEAVILDGIRALDLQARRAYFTNQSQVRLASYLAFAGVFVLLVALKSAAALTRRAPMPSKCPGGDSSWHNAALARRMIGAGGFGCLVVVVAVGYLTESMHFAARGRGEKPDAPSTLEPEDIPMPSGTNTAAARRPTTTGVVDDRPDSPADALPEVAPPPPPPPPPTSWPCFRGPDGLGIARVENPPTAWDGKSGSNVLWKVKVPRQGYNSPVVWEERVFVTGADDHAREVYCFNGDTGQILWQGRVDTVIEGELPEVSEDTGYAAPSTATDGKRVYAIFGTGDIAAFTLEGERVWSRSLGVPDNHYGHSSSLIMHGTNVIVQYDHSKAASILAIDGASGRTVWETPRDVKVAWTSPILARRNGREEIVLSANPFAISYDPANGKELWKVKCMGGEVGPSPAFANGYVFVANEYAKLVALDPGKQQILWENEDDLPDTASPLAVEDLLITASSAAIVTCYDAESGEVHWKEEFDEGFYGSPVFAGGMVYVMDMEGTTLIFKASKTYELVAKPQLGEGSFCTGAFVENRIYLRGLTHLFCVAESAAE